MCPEKEDIANFNYRLKAMQI